MKQDLKNKRVLVLGLGDTGLSALRWLRAQGALVSAADTRPAPPNLDLLQNEMPEVKTHLGPFTPAAFADSELIVASPGVAVAGPLAEPEVVKARRRGISVIGDIELFAQYKPASAKVIAITGSNGKSTVTVMVGEMCKAAGLKTIVAGNIGLPVLVALGMETPDVYVLELSSFQLETTHSLQADAATVLNICEDHMDRYASLADYAAAKERIFHGDGVQVVNRQDVWSRSMAQPHRRQLSFGTDTATNAGDFGLVYERGEAWLARGSQPLMRASELSMAGLHNVSNALAALALCHAIRLDAVGLLNTLRRFKGLPHRVEWVAEVSGVAFYDDSKGTNVGATCAAINGLRGAGRIVLIAGGDGKGQDFSPLRDAVAHYARAVVLIGRDGPQIGKLLANCEVPMHTAADMQQAVTLALKAAQPGDIVLLSPACASFDMYRNYAHRAEVFVAAVKALTADAKAVAP